MKIYQNFNFPNLFENQSTIILFSLLATTILLIGLVVLLLRKFLCWYLRINEINKQLISINVNIHNLSSKIDYLIKINSNKKIIPPNSIKIEPVTLQEKGESNSNFGTFDQNQAQSKKSPEASPEPNLQDRCEYNRN